MTIRQRACAAMFAPSFSDEFQGLLWAEATSTLIRLSNSVASTKDVKSADKLFYCHLPTVYKHLIQFGCVGWVKNSSKKVTKLDAKAIKYVMIGYSHNHSGVTSRMFNPKKKEDNQQLQSEMG